MGDVKFDEAAMYRLLVSPQGDVGRFMRRIGLKILAGAGTMSGVRTGDLRRRLYMKQGVRGRTQYVEVGSKSRHAYWHHEGTKPHLIVPENGRVLRFNVGGQTVYAKKVLRKGTRPNPYLVAPMKRAVRATR